MHKPITLLVRVLFLHIWRHANRQLEVGGFLIDGTGDSIDIAKGPPEPSDHILDNSSESFFEGRRPALG